MDLKSRISTIEDPLTIMDQLETKYGNAPQMQKDENKRIRNLVTPTNWAEQSATLNLAVNIIEVFREGPGTSSLNCLN